MCGSMIARRRLSRLYDRRRAASEARSEPQRKHRIGRIRCDQLTRRGTLRPGESLPCCLADKAYVFVRASWRQTTNILWPKRLLKTWTSRRAAAAEAVAAPEAPQAVTGIEAELDRLPTYARRLLQIRVPVRVTLASQRKSIQEIIELGPGSIVKFDKTCDEPWSCASAIGRLLRARSSKWATSSG